MAQNFWFESAVEPKRKFRWILKVDGIPYWTIKKVDKPSYTVSTSEHDFINHKFYFPGRVEYNEISFTIVDSANPDAAETLRQILFAGGYRLPVDENVATQSLTKHGAVSALGKIQIMQISGGGNQSSGAGTGAIAGNDEGDVLEFWTLHNAFVTSIELGDLDYSSDDLSEITVKIRYDFAQLNNSNVTPSQGALKVAQPVGTNFTPANVGEDPDRLD